MATERRAPFWVVHLWGSRGGPADTTVLYYPPHSDMDAAVRAATQVRETTAQRDGGTNGDTLVLVVQAGTVQEAEGQLSGEAQPVLAWRAVSPFLMLLACTPGSSPRV